MNCSRRKITSILMNIYIYKSIVIMHLSLILTFNNISKKIYELPKYIAAAFD